MCILKISEYRSSPRPCNGESAAESAQNGVLNYHLSSRDTVPNSVVGILNPSKTCGMRMAAMGVGVNMVIACSSHPV